MAYTDIDKPTDYFETELYSGSSSDVTMNALDFQPDWVWLKKISSSGDNLTYDSVRGTNKRLTINGTDEEVDRSSNNDELKSFNSDGWTLGTYNSNVTGAGSNCVSFNWKAGGSASSNSDGSAASSVSANTTAGFSIVSYTGNETAKTIGHGLGAIPQIVVTKNRSTAGQWAMYNRNLGANKNLHLEVTDAAASSSAVFNDTESTSSVFSVGNASMTNNNGSNFIAYCFAEKQGYSKFGSYTGNGSSDGVFVYTGFRPALVIIKRTDNSSGGNWLLLDSVRDDINAVGKNLYANVNDAETSTDRCDFVSNGFKLRQSGTTVNTSSGTYIYMAFAEAPFVTAGTKAAGTAR